MQGRRRSPLWAKVLVTVGAVMLVTSGTALAGANYALDRIDSSIDQQDLFDEPEGDDQESYGEDIRGPLNILLAGLDTRPSRPNETPRSDAIIIVHIPADLDSAYLISLPRDALVSIPPYEPAQFPGAQRDKLTHAMYEGADMLPGEESPNIARGFGLLSRTVSQLTGINRFDAGAVINFTGFTDIVDALGSITVELDERIVSLHRMPNGEHRPVGCGDYCGPQMVYEPGSPPCGPADSDGTFECELNGWQALDIARQRYIEEGDYGRQYNQQLVMEAMLGQAFSRDIVTNPVKLTQVLEAGGEALTFDGRGHDPIDYAFALRDIRPSSLVHVGVKGGSVQDAAGNYAGEELAAETYELFDALRLGTLDEFLDQHPDFVE